MDEAKKIAFDHYGFDEATLEPFFAQADENEDGQLDAVEFAGFRSVIRGRAVKNAQSLLPEVDRDSDGYVSLSEAEEKARREDDMDPKETSNLLNVADQDKNNKLDKVELADFVRLVRLSAIKYVKDHIKVRTLKFQLLQCVCFRTTTPTEIVWSPRKSWKESYRTATTWIQP